LDVQTVLGLAAGIPASFLSVGSDNDSVRALIDTTTFLTTMVDPPSVVTTSYGGDETNFSPQDLQYALSFGVPVQLLMPHRRKMCSGYMVAGARGISMIFSSGDNGVHETDDASSCSNNTFVVQFPGTCPYGQ
jgi:tripeptidyl-peptidase-1